MVSNVGLRSDFLSDVDVYHSPSRSRTPSLSLTQSSFDWRLLKPSSLRSEHIDRLRPFPDATSLIYHYTFIGLGVYHPSGPCHKRQNKKRGVLRTNVKQQSKTKNYEIINKSYYLERNLRTEGLHVRWVRTQE